MRFEHKFEYRLNLAENVDAYDIELPPMLIQPYLENAVRHGLTDIGRPGQIEVGFTVVGGYLKCSITDNGIGRAKAATISSKRLKSHRSVGMEITKKRIELLNEGNITGEVTVTDLYDSMGQASGTLVELQLPIKEH
ncbi:hypothetical protein BH09BAC1_BH09BAC1_29490 [soil metagenome]